MFTGQSEEQARRKILAVLLDETRKVLESARELPNVYKFVSEGKKNEIEKELLDAGFVNLKFHHRHNYSWTVVGENI